MSKKEMESGITSSQMLTVLVYIQKGFRKANLIMGGKLLILSYII
jgi:hypothetical protein